VSPESDEHYFIGGGAKLLVQWVCSLPKHEKELETVIYHYCRPCLGCCCKRRILAQLVCCLLMAHPYAALCWPATASIIRCITLSCYCGVWMDKRSLAAWLGLEYCRTN